MVYCHTYMFSNVALFFDIFNKEDNEVHCVDLLATQPFPLG